MLASEVLSDARRLLQDISSDRWTDAMLLTWLNEGQLKIISIAPSSNSEYMFFGLNHGVKQTVPTVAYALIDVAYNMTGSSDRGSAITKADEELLKLEDPDWATSTPSTTVVHWMQRPTETRTFSVYPPQPDGTAAVVELQVCLYPTVAVDGDTELDFSDEFQQVLVDYIVYRAYSEDRALEADDAAAAKHFQLFVEQLELLK